MFKLLALFILPVFAISLPVDQLIPIVRQFSNTNEDGSYNYAYETGNSIFVEEQGYQTSNETQVVQGQFQYTSPEGQVIRVTYTADENGYRPQGENLPTPPPIPPLIQRSLQYIKAVSQRGNNLK